MGCSLEHTCYLPLGTYTHCSFGATNTSFKFQVALLAVAYVVRKIVFGAIGPSELQRLYDRLWSFLVESLLAFTIFYCDIDDTFAVMLAVLLLVKSLHWLAADRIDWMDRRPHPGPSLLIHTSTVALCAVLWVTDVLLFLFAADRTAAHGIGCMIFFAGDYGILIATVANTTSRYLLYAYERRRTGKQVRAMLAGTINRRGYFGLK
ncbi:hypothetical protein B0H13DRAFT_1083764 [Mycena leptocephala]|nr:hypothetical protein B0H13DRAFT_1083764 [Mycena leptocephala]